MDGLKNGKGTYYYANGNIFEGIWKNDKKEGYGVYSYLTTGEKYEGDWMQGEKHGQGTFHFAYGDV